MEWNFTGSRPIWQQLAEQLTLRILKGEYPPGSRLPAVRDIAGQAGVNPNTMQRAMAQLEQDGLAIGGRAAFFALPGFKPVAAMVILSGVAFGGEAGFLVGAVTMLGSNMLFSQGPWTPWQMFAMGLLGLTAGILYRKGLLRRGRLSLSVFGAAVTLLLYGGIMNPASVLMYQPNPSWPMIWTAFLTGLPADLVHAAATFFFLWFLSQPMLEKLDRVKVKYGLLE